MKKSLFQNVILIFTCLLLTSSLVAQSPQGIPYQAVMRHADGTVMASSAVSLTFMIHDGTADGTVVYQESHSLNSNAQGLVSCVVGNGVVSEGNFENINWGGGAKFLHVMMGSDASLTDLGTQQMLSVPYALHSSSSDNAVNATNATNAVNATNATNAVNAQTAANGISGVSQSGDTLYMANGTFIIVPGISAANANNGGGGNNTTSGLGSVVLPGNNTCTNEYIHVVGCGGQTSLTYDGRTYDLVEIGGQCWFADNLATDQYRNGDAIPTGLSNTQWQNTTSGAYAIYNNDPANDATYGKLYNWYTTVDSRGLCPTGWHVPTDCEWMYLEGSIGMSVQQQEVVSELRGSSEGGALKSTEYWYTPNTGATNTSGFTALPGGWRVINGAFGSIGYSGDFWTSSENDSNGAWARGLDNINSYINRVSSLTDYKQFGFSVRCVRDSELSPIQGCTDGAACNFLANANQDDGSCLYLNATCNDNNANTMNDVITANCQCAGVLMVSGCTNPQACNYNAAANVDNGSCLIQGAACNDNNANTTNDVINGSCVCAGTAVGNGIYTQGNGVTDIDGNTYTSIIINGQEWMQQNLAVTKYRNGDPIPTGLDNTTWSSTTNGAYAIYNNDPANDATYGKLYNWYAVNDSRGLCPTGWHVPSDAEWSAFINYLDPNANGGNSTPNLAGGKMKAATGWNSSNTGSTNESGFTGLPGGCRYYDGMCYTIGDNGYWWSRTELDSNVAWYRTMPYYYSGVGRYDDSKRNGFSVRCVRD